MESRRFEGPEGADVALTAVSVANLGAEPGFDLGPHLVTQVPLAEPLTILRESSDWYLAHSRGAQATGWVRRSSVRRVKPDALAAYRCGPHVLVTERFADIVLPGAPSGGPRGSGRPRRFRPVGRRPVSDAGGEPWRVRLVLGTLLPLARSLRESLRGGYRVRLPSGRVGFLESRSARRLSSAYELSARPGPVADIVALAENLVGLPFLKGGSTPHGLDCSGFVQLVFRMNGYHLPREAEKQFSAGIPVEDRNRLRPADLVFFATHGHRPSHVGICVGRSRCVHCGPGGVVVRGLHPSDPDYSLELNRAYFGARRVAREE